MLLTTLSLAFAIGANTAVACNGANLGGSVPLYPAFRRIPGGRPDIYFPFLIQTWNSINLVSLIGAQSQGISQLVDKVSDNF